MTDSLVADLLARRPEALDDLLSQYGGQIYAVTLLILRNPADAEEVTADTLATAWWKIGGLRDPQSLRPWLLRIATRLAIRRVRRTQGFRVVSLELANELEAPEHPVTDRIVLNDALDRLPPRMRAVVALHYVAGLSVPETAEAVARSANTVKSQLREATARLKRDISDVERSTGPTSAMGPS